MNRAIRIFLFLPLVMAAALQAAEPVPAAAFTERAKRTKERIDLLFRHHDDPPAPVAPNQNPFRTPADVPVASASSSSAAPVAEEPTSDEALLKQAVATLKIGGSVQEPSGEISISINGELYKENKSITARVRDTPVYGIRIRRITLSSVTFVLNDAEVIQRF